MRWCETVIIASDRVQHRRHDGSPFGAGRSEVEIKRSSARAAGLNTARRSASAGRCSRRQFASAQPSLRYAATKGA